MISDLEQSKDLMVEELIKELNSTDWGVSSRAPAKLALIGGERVVAVLIGALEHPYLYTRKFAARALGDLRAKEAFESLLKALNDPEEQVQAEAISALYQLKNPDAVEPIINLLSSATIGMRPVIIRILGDFRDIRAFDSFINALKDESSHARRDALFALGKLKDKRAIEPAIKALEDEATEVRRAAVVVIAKLGGNSSEVIKQLAAKLDSPEYKQRFGTALVLAKLNNNPKAIQILLDALDLEDVGRKIDAIIVLSQIKDERVVDVFVKLLKRPDDGRVRSAVFDSLGRMGDARAIPILLEILTKRDEPLRYMVVAALGNMGKQQAVGPMLELLHDEEFSLRWFAAEALGNLGDKQAVEPLIAVLNDPNPDVRYGAALALGKLGDERALSKLEWMSKNDRSYNFEEKQVSKAARGAIKLITKNLN